MANAMPGLVQAATAPAGRALGIFVGLWPPTLMALGRALESKEETEPALLAEG